MNKKLSKEIMKISRHRNKFLNKRSDLDRKAYNTQRNYAVSLLRKDSEPLSYSEPSTALSDDSSIESNTKEIILGITIDRDLKFDEHANNLCKKSMSIT